MKDQPSHEGRLSAKAITARQGALQMMEVRQRKIDSWLEDAPLRMSAVGSTSKARSLRSHSEPALPSGTVAAVGVTREVYEKLGFLVGRSKGSTAGGYNGAKAAPRRHNPLSLNALMFSGNVVDGGKSRSLSRSSLPKKPSKQWQLLPESSFVFDPRTSLPVPRGGWNSQPQTSWTEPPSAGGREWSAPVTFDARPKASTMEALAEYAQSPSAIDRGVTAGSASATVRKMPYGDGSGQERTGLGPQALSASTRSFGNTAASVGSPSGAAQSPSATQ